MIWLSKYCRFFSEFKNLRMMEGKITRSRRLLPYWWKFKGCQKISGSKWRFRFKIRFKGNQFFQQIGGKLSYTINRRQWAGATIGRVVDTAHTGSFITRRSHLNLLWNHIMLSTPMIYTFYYGQSTENLKTTPWVILRLGGYNDMTQQILPVFQWIQEPQDDGGKDNPVPEATTILMKI